MNDTFTEAELKSLLPFFTNVEEPVFGLKLPEEVAGALFSRYSRSTKGLRRTFLDEFLGDPELALRDLLGGQLPVDDQSAALKKARAFYDRVLVGYGDDSVAQLGGASVGTIKALIGLRARDRGYCDRSLPVVQRVQSSQSTDRGDDART